MLRYIEANAKRASLVSRAEDWEWSSLRERMNGDRDLLSHSPLPFWLPEGWVEIVNAPLDEIERDNYHVLTQRISLTPLRKLWLAWKTYVRG